MRPSETVSRKEFLLDGKEEAPVASNIGSDDQDLSIIDQERNAMLPRIKALSNDEAHSSSTRILRAVENALGVVPNLHRTLAHAPAALGASTSMARALADGVLDPKLRESVALATAGRNQCGYCASAHSAIGKACGLEEEEIFRNLSSDSGDSRSAAMLQFVSALIDSKGAVSDAELAAIREAGFSDQEIVEITTHVGMNLFTNMFNFLARTEIDFPVVSLAK